MNPRSLFLVLCAGVAVATGLTSVLHAPPAPGPPVPSVPVTAVASASSTVAAIDLLRVWDERRARAWARGDLDALRHLYTPRSRSGRDDRAALASYVDRGLRVTGLRTQLLAVEVELRTGHLLVLLVTDRLTRAFARGHGRDVLLPRDEPTRWRLVMHRVAGEWRVGEVRRARR